MTTKTMETLRRRGLLLEYFTIGWNVIEALVAVAAGIAAGSIALVGFGFDFRLLERAPSLGATGLTFIDDLVSRYFDTATSPLLVAPVGVPDTPHAPAGRPGQPAALRRYDQLMDRVSLHFQRSRRGH